MATLDILSVMNEITRSAEKNNPEVRFIKKMEIGKVVRQGDIYIHKVSENHKKGPITSNQLAQGTSKGSRHLAESPAESFEGNTLPSYAKEAFLGPVVISRERFTISHPEHAHISLPAGTYQITHQMDARTLQRVRD